MTRCQITCKSLKKSSICQNFLRVWHLVIFRADQSKITPSTFNSFNDLLLISIVSVKTSFQDTTVHILVHRLSSSQVFPQQLSVKGKTPSQVSYFSCSSFSPHCVQLNGPQVELSQTSNFSRYVFLKIAKMTSNSY